MESFSAYGHTLVSMAILVLIWSVLSPVSAVKKQNEGTVSGAIPEADYGSATYRWHRAHANLSETMPFFVAAASAAMFAGVSAHVVNLLSSLFMVSRLILAIATIIRVFSV